MNERLVSTVIVAMRGLSKERVAEVAMACERVPAKMVSWKGDLPQPTDRTVVVGGLPEGERRIPEELLSALTSTGSSTSALLICEESLVRPCVSLYSGRVMLLGAESTAEAIASRLRVLLAEPWSADCAGELRECVHPNWWSRNTTPGQMKSLQFAEDHGGFTLLFAIQGALTLTHEVVAEVRACLRDANPSAHVEDGIPLKIGPDTGVIHYNPSQGEAYVYWPSIGPTLWLLSALRLPILSNLSRGNGTSTRIRASGGDVMIALSREGAGTTSQEIARTLPARAAWGGPSVFDAVNEKLTLRPDLWATVTELR